MYNQMLLLNTRRIIAELCIFTKLSLLTIFDLLFL